MAVNSEQFVMVRHSVINAGLTPQAFMLYAVLTKYADSKTHEAFPSRQTLAAYIGVKKANSVDRYLTELEDAGLITTRMRYRSKDDARNTSSTKSAEHPIQTSNVYTVSPAPNVLPQVVPLSATEGYPLPLERTTPSLHRGYELEPLNQTHVTTEIHSVIASSDRAEGISVDASATPNPEPLPFLWTPNKSHIDHAEKPGVDVDIQDAVRRFRRWACPEQYKHEKRRNWDSTFGNFINEVAAGTNDVTYPGSGDEFEDHAADVIAFPSERVRGAA